MPHRKNAEKPMETDFRGNAFHLRLFYCVANINDHRFAALQFRCGILRRNFRDVLLRFRDEFLETRVLSHNPNLTTDYTDGTDGFWSAATCRRLESADMSAHSKS